MRFSAMTSFVLVFVPLLFGGGCAAERLEAREPGSGPTSASAATVAVTRPTDLHASDRQLAGPAADPKKPAPAEAPRPADDKPYACPMHPEVRSEKPGGVCPKCGMQLTKPAPAP